MIEDVFRIIKADRYTKDGCDEIQKAKDNLAEDEKYNIGDISKKTGLQKTAQGWRPPKETKFGKVKQNKEGQWGVQTKQGKGSDFLKHKSEKEASRALANYTAGYNTTERSKQDPHSDQARQVKHWDKEVDKIRKKNRAEGRAAHAAQFQKPAAEEPKNVHGAEVDKIYERQLKRIKELKAKGFTDEQIDNDKIIKQTKEDMKNVGKKPGTDYPLLKKEDHVKLAKEVISNTMPGGSEWSAEDIAKEWKLGKADAEEVKKAMQAVKIDEANKKLEARRAQAQKIQKGVENYLSKKNGTESKPKSAEEALKTFNKMTGSNKSDFESVKSDYNKALEKNTGKPAAGKAVSTQEFIKIPTARGYAKVPKEAYSKYADNKKNVRLSNYIDRKMVGKPVSENNKFYEFVKNKIYESGEDPAPYLGQGGYSYPQSLLDTYYDEWTSKTSDAAPRVLTGDCKIRIRK